MPIVLGIVFAGLLLCLFSVPAFTFGGHYIAEIPIAIFAVTAIFSTRGMPPSVFKALVNGLAASLLLVGPFAVLGLLRGAPLTDVYADARAIGILIIAAYLLFALPREAAITFCVSALFTTLVLDAGVFALRLSEDVLSVGSIITGKVILPMEMFAAGLVWLAMTNRTLFLVTFGLLAYVVVNISYRTNYIILGLILFAAIAGQFLVSRHISSATKIAIISGAGGAVAYVAATTSFNPIVAVYIIEKWMKAFGLPVVIVQQIVQKSARAYLGTSGKGDQLYATYYHSFLDFGRFGLPHGLGRKSAYGTTDIFGGNIIDSTTLYLNYTFSLWATLAIIAAIGHIFLKTTSGLPFLRRIGALILISPLLGFAIIRPHYLAYPQNATSMAIAIFLCSVILGRVTSKSERCSPSTDSGHRSTPIQTQQ